MKWKTFNFGGGLPGLLGFMAILGIIMAMSIPSFSEWSHTATIKHEARAVEHLLNRLVLLAQEREGNITATISDSRISTSGVFRVTKYVKPPLHFGPLQEQAINFYPTGVTSPLSFYLSGYNMTCLFIVSLRGRIRTQCFE